MPCGSESVAKNRLHIKNGHEITPINIDKNAPSSHGGYSLNIL